MNKETMIKEQEKEEILNSKTRIRAFFTRRSRVHCTVKRSKLMKPIFYNGIIKEVKKFYFVLEDEVEGEKMIFYTDLIKPIEDFREKRE